MEQDTMNLGSRRSKPPAISFLATAAVLSLSICPFGACQEPPASSAGSSTKPAAQTGSSSKTPMSEGSSSKPAPALTTGVIEKIRKTDEQWRAQLTPTEYQVTRMKGTERPFTGKYWDNKQPGIYVCKCCELPLFDASTKFKSGTGWPSFFKAIDDTSVTSIVDLSHGMRRTENTCNRCDAHLGHVFNDGPAPTGLRYCMNSAALEFRPAQSETNSTATPSSSAENSAEATQPLPAP